MAKRKFKKGDRVTIIKNQSDSSIDHYGHHHLCLGGEYTIAIVDTEHKNGYHIVSGDDFGWVFEDEIDFIKATTAEFYPVDRQFVIDAWDAADPKQKEVIAKYGLNVFDKVISVPKELIIEGHKAACKEWKKKIERKFQNTRIFKESIEDTIKSIVDKIGPTVYCDYKVEISGTNIYVPLPQDNSKWLYEAVDWAERYEAEIKKEIGSSTIVSIDIPTFGKGSRKFSTSSMLLNYFTIQIIN